MFSEELACGACGRTTDASPGATVCGACGKPLLARYDTGRGDPAELARAWGDRSGGMWRFRELLPLRADEPPVTLGEGGTPLLPVPDPGGPLGGVRLLVKDEGRNPTGSFKDRGLSAAVTRAARDGAEAFVIPSAGNAGAALSAYAARAGLPARVFVPADTPEGVRRRCRAFGAELEQVEGLIDECGRRAAEHAERTGAFDVSTLHEPYRVEGKKTMMLEIAEALGWRAPDAVVYPTGGGTGLIATWKVLEELEEIGRLEDVRTRLYAVQSEGCAPMVRAWREGREEARPWDDPGTGAWGLRVPSALGDFLVLRALRGSGGGALAVSDEAMRSGARELGARAGVHASIEGGATLAAARELARRGEIAEGEEVVLFNTAHGLVY